MFGKRFTFSQRVRLGFAATISTAAVIGLNAIFAIRSVNSVSDSVVFDNAQALISVERLRVQAELEVAAIRGYIISDRKMYLERFDNAKLSFEESLSQLRSRASSPEDAVLVRKIETLHADYVRSLEQIKSTRNGNSSLKNLIGAFETRVQKKRDQLESTLTDFISLKTNQFENGKKTLLGASSHYFYAVATISVLAVLLAAMLAFLFGRILIRLYEDSQKATRLRDEIVTIVSHDLRNGLTSIGLNVSFLNKTLLGEVLDRERASRTIQAIQKSVNKMSSFIESVLDVTRIEGGNLSVSRAPVRVDKIIDDIVLIFSPLVLAKGIHLECKLVEPSIWIDADYQKIVQALSNLVGNAIKFTPSGGLIRVEVTPAHEEVIFSVADSGMGIPEEKLPFVFDRFWQGSGQARSGLGLGLAIVKGIVEAHQGEIKVESSLGRGTRFSFSIRRHAGMTQDQDVSPGLLTKLKSADDQKGSDFLEVHPPKI